MGFPLKKKRGVHRLARACSVGRDLGVAWAWLGRAWLGRGVGVAWAWRGRGVGAAWAWAWLGRGVGVAWAWRGRGVGVIMAAQRLTTATLKLALGKWQAQRLSNSYLKTGARKMAGAKVEQ